MSAFRPAPQGYSSLTHTTTTTTVRHGSSSGVVENGQHATSSSTPYSQHHRSTSGNGIAGSNSAGSSGAQTHEQRQHQHFVAPDDSDFMESEDGDAVEEEEDAEGEEDPDQRAHRDREETVTISRQVRTNSTSPNRRHAQPMPIQPLIQLAPRFYFAVFDHPAPHSSVLNANHGVESALFPSAPSLGYGNHVRRAFEEELYNTSPGSKGKQRDPRGWQPYGKIPKKFHWLTIDEDLQYAAFWDDWGPLNAAMLYRFTTEIDRLLRDKRLADHGIVLYTSSDPRKKANAATLAALRNIIQEPAISPADAFQPFAEMEFQPFRDAGYGRADFYLTMQDVLWGIYRARSLSLFDLTTFNLDEYEHFEQVQNGDWNWITPQFIAFASPNDKEYVRELALMAQAQAQGLSVVSKSPYRKNAGPPQNVKNVIDAFKSRNVKSVVRLNNPLYDKDMFVQQGMEHLELYFDDGSNPSDDILHKFIDHADRIIEGGGVVAVHCKAGLGRTGVLIGAYLIWKFSFNANEVIGLMRVMRPGCVVGPQQQFIYENCQEWVKWGEQARAYKQADKMIREEKRKMAAEIAKLQNQLREERSRKRKEVFDSQERDSDSDEEVAKMFTPRPTKIATFAAGTSVGGAHLAATQAQSTTAAPSASSALPAYKPPPCVGQPRKSPSPSRKRPAALAPATIAKMGGRSENLFPTDSHFVNSNSEAATGSIRPVPPPQPAFVETQNGANPSPRNLVASQEAEDKEELIEAPETPSRTSRAGSPPKSSQISVLGSAQGAKQEYPTRTSSHAAPMQAVLGEAHRLNMQPLPPALPTTPPTPKGGFFGRVERVVETISATLSGTPPSPRQLDSSIGRASPKVRDRYGLKDVSRLPRPASPVAMIASADAETLGVIGTIAPLPAMAPSPVKTRSRSMARRGATAIATAPAVAPVAPAARKRPVVATATAPARTLSRTTTRSVSASSSSSSGSAASRPGSRTAARHALSSRSTVVAPRSQRVAGTARPTAATRNPSVSSSSQASATSAIPPRYTVKSSSQPSYMAPTGASLKRSRGQLLTPDLGQEELPAGPHRTASGRNVRPRRSNSIETLSASAPAQASARR